MNDIGKQSLEPISISEARKVMGKAADDMTDEEIEEAIYNLTAIARSFLSSVLKS